jgi:mannose-6-phosphate isomerase-like protein (cupin superfamily)
MIRHAVRVPMTLLALLPAVVTAQSGTAKPPVLATDVTAAEIQTVLKAPTGGTDRQIKVVDIGKYNVAVGVLRRGATKAGSPVSAINHEHVTEVYYVISGEGTLVTGGTVTGVKPLPPDGELVTVAVGPSNIGTFVHGAQTRKIGPGDVVIIPAGVYHGFSEVPDHIHYLSVRPDAEHVLPAGYVHPLLKK